MTARFYEAPRYSERARSYGAELGYKVQGMGGLEVVILKTIVADVFEPSACEDES